jgi:hypothetical protein
MKIRDLCRREIFLLSVAFWVSVPAHAATLDQLYTPLLTPSQQLYTARGDFFTMREKGHHGSASFDAFYSNPQYYSWLNAIRFSPVAGWDLSLGYRHTFPTRYERPTENHSNAVTSHQNYYIHGLQDFTLDTRYRRGAAEYYFSVLEKRHKTSWDFATSQTVAPTFFNYFRSNYEDIKIGARLLDGQAGKTLFTRPLLDAGQLGSEWELGYKNGRLDRDGAFYVADIQQRSYNHRTHHHFLPRVGMRYGLSAETEVETGLTYTTPVKYDFDFRQYKNSGLTNFISGTYTWDNSIQVPLKMRYRPTENWEFAGGLDYRYLKQSFDSWERSEAGALTETPSKKLKYYNIKPQLGVNFITAPEAEKPASEIEAVTRDLLARHQWALSFNIFRDFTSLDKNDANGAQNLADPYNVYLYPVENFVSGSEYAAFFSGNTAVTPGNVDPQNYLQLALGGRYGLTESWEAGLSAGYRTPTSVHQYSLGDKSDRYFVFKPYYYVDFSTDWNITKDSLLSFKLHFVPDYKTELDTSITPESFSAHTRYLDAGVSFQKLF